MGKLYKVIQHFYTWNDNDARHDLGEAGDEVGHVDVPADVLEVGGDVTVMNYFKERKSRQPKLDSFGSEVSASF